MSTAAILHLPHHMTVGASPALCDALLPLTHTDDATTLDANGVDVLSAAGAQALVAFAKSMDGRPFTLSPASGSFTQSLRELGLHWLLDHHA
jgi:anti-anti-sigma regulatory factor